MFQLINRMKLFFLGLFLLSSATVFVYHLVWVWPERRCLARQDWWDWRERTCAHPVIISDITGRPIKDVRAAERAERAAQAAKAATPAT